MRVAILAFLAFAFLVPGIAFAHGMSEADQIRAAEGGFLDFFPLGAIHMLTGYDHLLFLFGVVFFLTKFSDIVKFVTAFTLGHSITLIFATFLGIQANYFLIDAVIALTVCYKGFDNLNGFKKYFNVKSPNLLAAVFIFGLIHGFGLSTRLQQVTIGEGWPLLGKIISFNIGVEAGQIVALTVILVFLSTWRRTKSFTHFSNASNAGLIIVGCCLFIMQIHGFQHETDPGAFAFDSDSHAHAHQQASMVAQPSAETLPEGWHIDPGSTVPHTHGGTASQVESSTKNTATSDSTTQTESAELPAGWHIDPGQTTPHSHGENATLPVDTYIVPREEPKIPLGWHIDPGATKPHKH